MSNGPNTAGNNSRIEFNSATVINVDSVLMYNAAFSGRRAKARSQRERVGTPPSAIVRQSTSAAYHHHRPSNVTQVNNQLMTAQGVAGGCGLTTSATCVFQYQFTVPAAPSLGGWTVRVTGNEGTEGTVTDLGVGNFSVVIPQPSITVLKTSVVVSDPVNASNPKRIPLSVVATTSLTNRRHRGREFADDH